MPLSVRPALPLRRGARRPRAAAAVALSLAALAGCVTTTRTVTTDGADDGPVSTQDGHGKSDKADLERRANIHLDLAREYFKDAQYSTALDEVRQALAARPDRPDAFALRGLIYGAMGDPASAETAFRRAIDLKPDDGDTLHNYGWVLCQERRFPEADAQFDRAMALPGYFGKARTALAQGVCQARAGNLPAAEKTLAHAYELDPSNPFTAFNLADVLYRRAEYVRARFYVRRINDNEKLISAQSLWLAIRIEHRMNDAAGMADLGRQLRERFPQSPEVKLLDKGRFDD